MQKPIHQQRNFIAHQRKADGAQQSLEDHLRQVGKLAALNASKLNNTTDKSESQSGLLEVHGELLGLLHDLGKYSKAFQDYLGSAIGLIDQDADDYVDATKLRGHIDHSTAGAQFIWKHLSKEGPLGQLVGQVLGLWHRLTPFGFDRLHNPNW